jgi:hypothetical protein
MKPLGFQTEQFGNDDNAAFAWLAQQAREAENLRQYQPYIQEYMQNAAQFQAWQQAQRQQQQYQEQQRSQWFRAPEFDPRWRELVYKDQNGEWRARPGQDPSIVNKFLAANQHQLQFLDRFAFDPMGAIGPGIQQIAAQVAQQIVQQQLGGYQDTQFAQSYIQQNSSWLHARDEQGNVQMGANGVPALSPWGQQFASYLLDAQRMGIQSEQGRAQYAYTAVQRDYALWKVQGGGAQQAQQNANQQFLQQQAGTAPQSGGSLPTNPLSPNNPSQNPSLGLKERLTGAFARNGITNLNFDEQRA